MSDRYADHDAAWERDMENEAKEQAERFEIRDRFGFGLDEAVLMSTKQGTLETLVGVLKDLRAFAETVRPDSTSAQVTAAKDSANRGLRLLDQLAAALERAEQERELEAQLVGRLQQRVRALYNQRQSARPRAEKAERRRDVFDEIQQEQRARAMRAERALADLLKNRGVGAVFSTVDEGQAKQLLADLDALCGDER